MIVTDHDPERRSPAPRSPEPAPLDKPALRAIARRRRRVLAAAGPDAAPRAASRLPLERLPAFRVVAGYKTIGAELDPAPVLARLAAAGGCLVLPRVYGEALVFEDETGAAGRPDLVVAPLLAFDRRGGRLGQGGGHYDRAIAALRAAGRVFVLGLAYAGQEVPALPAEPHDQRLDAILTEMDYEAFRLE